MKKIIIKKKKKSIRYAVLISAGVLALILTACGSSGSSPEDNGKVYVYNWGDYLDQDTITQFEDETGIEVVYDEYETNEIMYPKVDSGAAQYDVICPSDYMIQRMIQNNMLQELDFDQMPNAKENIGKEYYEQAEEFDPGNKYAVPYCFGTVGILYNTTMVDDTVDSWSILWNDKYKDSILMQDSVRDAFMIPLKLNGNSMNSTDEEELAAARDMLIQQKDLVQAYVVDEARDKMIADEAALAVIYSGEALYAKNENPNLEYVIPKEGTNVWIDAWVVPKNAPNVENAYKFIDFMCRGDIAEQNFEYLTYSTPNTAARELIPDESVRNSELVFPDLSKYDNLETYKYLGEDADKLYDDMWKQVKSE